MKTLRSLIVAAKRPRFSGSFLPLPLRHRQVALAVVLALGGIGCAGQSWKVASYLNEYDYRFARYVERCVDIQVAGSDAVLCRATKANLDAFRKHLNEAAVALKNGGAATLQVSQIKTDAKGLK